MKITIEISQKTVNLAAVMVTAETDDAKFETTVRYAVKDFPELNDDAFKMKLGHVLISIGQKLCANQRKEEEPSVAAVREEPFNPEKHVHPNFQRDRKAFPFCFSLTVNGTNTFGVAKTKEEAIEEAAKEYRKLSGEMV